MRDRIALGVMLACLQSFAIAAGAADAVPTEARNLVPNARLQGSGEMRYLGLPIYEGRYWSAERGYSTARPFALELRYHRSLSGARIAGRSVDEIGKLGYGSSAERARWGELMTQLFPDVRSGDRLTGVNVPGQGARFFRNGEPIGAITDPAFAQAFFGIWFDPKTSRPEFRRQLGADP